MSGTSTIATVLHVAGYPTAVALLTRFVPVVRERRVRWFLAHEAGMAAITGGWVLRGDNRAAAVNGTWLVLAAVWYALGGRHRTRRTA